MSLVIQKRISTAFEMENFPIKIKKLSLENKDAYYNQL